MSEASKNLKIALDHGAKAVHAKSLVSGHKNTSIIESLKITPKQLDQIIEKAFEEKLQEWINKQPTVAWMVEFPKFQDYSLEFQDPKDIVYGPAWEEAEKVVTELFAKKVGE